MRIDKAPGAVPKHRFALTFASAPATHFFLWAGALAATLVVFSQTPDFYGEIVSHALGYPQVILLEFIVPLLLIYLFYYITGAVWLSVGVPSLFLFAVCIVNKYKVFLRGDPFMPTDIILGGEALNIVSSSSINIGAGSAVLLALIILGCAALGVFVRFRAEKPRTRAIGAAVTAILCAAAYFGIYMNDAVYASIPIKHNEFNMVNEYNSKGFALAFLHNIKKLDMSALRPEGYSARRAREILEKYGAQAEGGGDGRPASNGNGGGDGQQAVNGEGGGAATGAAPPGFRPDVIMLMSEAFWDITQIPALVFDGGGGIGDPIPRYHSLEMSSIAGTLYASVYGGGTDTTEFNVLTGHSIANFGAEVASAFKLIIRKDTDSIVRTFAANGYSTVALHPGFPWFYNRRNVYPWLGFEEFVDIGAFDQASEISGNYISDAAMTKKLIGLYERYTGGGAASGAGAAGDAGNAGSAGSAGAGSGDTEAGSAGAGAGDAGAGNAVTAAGGGKPLFCFAVSIQNHGPYDAGYMYGEMAKNYLTAPEITLSIKSDYAITNYIRGLEDADASLGTLVDYLEGVGRPVVLVFFGDHAPGLGRNFSAYKELGYPIGYDAGLAEKANIYTVRYVIWANAAARAAWPGYETLRAAGAGRMSANYLGGCVTRMLGLERGAYEKLLDRMRERLPAYHQMFYGTGAEDGAPLFEGNPAAVLTGGGAVAGATGADGGSAGAVSGADGAAGVAGAAGADGDSLSELIDDYKTAQYYKIFDEKIEK